MSHSHIAGLVAATMLSAALAACSGPGGDASVAPKATPAPIVFTGSNVTDNVMALQCNIDQTFTVSQKGYSGEFTLAPSSGNFDLTPTSGTSSTTFTVSSGYGDNAVWTVTATGENGTTGVLTIDYSSVSEECG